MNLADTLAIASGSISGTAVLLLALLLYRLRRRVRHLEQPARRCSLCHDDVPDTPEHRIHCVARNLATSDDEPTEVMRLYRDDIVTELGDRALRARAGREPELRAPRWPSMGKP